MKILILKLIELYKKIISPIPHYLAPRCGCRFYPTCSEYARQAIIKSGLLKGGWKGIKRIIRCHPFSSGGHDPI